MAMAMAMALNLLYLNICIGIGIYKCMIIHVDLGFAANSLEMKWKSMLLSLSASETSEMANMKYIKWRDTWFSRRYIAIYIVGGFSLFVSILIAAMIINTTPAPIIALAAFAIKPISSRTTYIKSINQNDIHIIELFYRNHRRMLVFALLLFAEYSLRKMKKLLLD